MGWPNKEVVLRLYKGLLLRFRYIGYCFSPFAYAFAGVVSWNVVADQPKERCQCPWFEESFGAGQLRNSLADALFGFFRSIRQVWAKKSISLPKLIGVLHGKGQPALVVVAGIIREQFILADEAVERCPCDLLFSKNAFFNTGPVEIGLIHALLLLEHSPTTGFAKTVAAKDSSATPDAVIACFGIALKIAVQNQKTGPLAVRA